MQTLIATVSRAHSALEVRFAEKAPTGASQNVAAVEHLRVDDRVAFWFRNHHTCRLCPESRAHANPTMHFNMGQEARNHTTRECFLSYFMEEIKLGVYTGSSRWITRLAKKRDDSIINTEIVRRIVAASASESKSSHLSAAQALYENTDDPASTLTPKELRFEANVLVMQSSFLSTEQAESIVRMPPLIRHRCRFMRHVLGFLRSINVLGPSLVPARATGREAESLRPLSSVSSSFPSSAPLRTTNANNTARFEFNEYIGDSLGTRGSAGRIITMMPHRDWISVQHGWALGILRDGVESNHVLMILAEMIGVQSLLDKDVILGGGKPLADVLESVVGELFGVLAMYSSAPVGQPLNLPLLHTLAGSVLPHDIKVVEAITKWALEELSDLVALVFAFHFGASPRLEPFLRELMYSHARMAPLAACKSDKSPRPVPVSRRFSRMLASSVSSSSSSAAAAGVQGGDGPFAPSGDFTHLKTSLAAEASSVPDSAAEERTAIVSIRDGSRLRRRRRFASDVDRGTFANQIRFPGGAFESYAATIIAPIIESAADAASKSRDDGELRQACALHLEPEKKSRSAGDSSAAMNLNEVFRFESMLSSIRPVVIDESRVFDDTRSFEINTGRIPEVVRLAELRRQEEFASRKKMRAKRQI